MPPCASAIVSAGQPSSTIVAHERRSGARRVSTTARASEIGLSLREHRADRVAELVLVGRELEFHEPVRLRGSRNSATNARRSIFSPAVSGSSARTTSASGSLYAARCGPANARSSSSVGTRAGSRGTIDRDADLAHHVVGPGHDRDRGDVGVRRQHALDLDGVHVVPAAHVHLLAAADEPQAALVVDPTEVAGAHEPVGGERGARSARDRASSPTSPRGSAGRPRRPRRAARGWSSASTQRELDARVRAPDADDRVLVGVVERGAEPDAGLGARVARREPRAEPAARFLGEAGCDRPAAGDDEACTLERSKRVEVGMAQHERELRRARPRPSSSSRVRGARARRPRASAP